MIARSLWRRSLLALAMLAAYWLGTVAPLGAATPAATARGTALDRYLSSLATLRANFTQSLTDSRGRALESLSGTLVVLRPGRFRWEVRPDSATSSATQLMVADGRNVWFYDRDLQQVTVKPAAGALTATPATLLAGSADLRPLFNVADAPHAQDLDWVLVKPRRNDAEFREARLGFAGAELRRMVIKDKLGQTATFDFTSIIRNAPVAPAEVSFTPPAGVDVIGKPVN
jgi:outer membrane lipoprotein carrier protein